MPTSCCVPFCKNNHKTPNVSFHTFTNDPKMRKIWIHKIKRDTRKNKNNPKPFNPNKYTKICSAHFLRRDYRISSEKSRLRKDAIPTIFPWTNNKDQRKNPLLKNEMKSNFSDDTLENTGEPQEPLPAMRDDLEAEDPLDVSTLCYNVAEPRSVDTCVEDNRDIEFVQVISDFSVENIPDTDHVTAAPDMKLTENDRSILSQYTALIIEHRDFVRTCKCQNAPVQIDKSNNVSFDICHGTLIENRRIFNSISNSGPLISIEMLKDDDSEVRFYTGFSNYNMFQISLNILFENGDDSTIKMNYKLEEASHQHHLTRENEYLLVLMKLRQNFPCQHLARLFQVSVSTVSNTFISWVNFMYVRLAGRDIWPKREILFSHYSDTFKQNYPNVIGFLDAMELFIQTPSSLTGQSETFSRYKNDNNLKGLVAVDANGMVIFVSALFTGSISDNKLLQRSGFTKLVESKLRKEFLLSGDTFLADKGFTATELLNPVNISIPVFRFNNVQFSENEISRSQTIAMERVHVERAIGRVKTFKILRGDIPLTLVGSINQIWTICCLLSNFQMPLRKFGSDLTG